METTIFLDIDGVLNDYNTTVYNTRNDILGKYNISLEKLNLLKQLIKELMEKLCLFLPYVMMKIF